MEKEKQVVWFPAKRYGWGWGPPQVWQGWAVLAEYAVLLLISAYYFLKAERIAAYVVSVVMLTIALLIVCWLKGEKPRWLWGRRD